MTLILAAEGGSVGGCAASSASKRSILEFKTKLSVLFARNA
jgi:hypothetical protein